jgi:peptidoglycan hydrolase-like protein with peptidoglycan-binding domain
VDIMPNTSGAVITWYTDEAATSTLEFGTTASYGDTRTNASLYTRHSYELDGLRSGTAYHFRMRATDAAGNSTTTADYTFTTRTPSSGGSGGSSGGSGNSSGGNSSVKNTEHADTAEAGDPVRSDPGNGQATVPSYVFLRDLAVGSEGDDVRVLQQMLVGQGLLRSESVIGYFGPLTQQALAAFQSARGISPASGYFGPLTRATVMGVGPQAAPTQAAPAAPTDVSASSFGRDLEVGSQGEDVRALQRLLNAQGFPVAQSGPGSAGNETDFFGPATQQALAAFQSARGISPASGYFGPLTRSTVSGGN